MGTIKKKLHEEDAIAEVGKLEMCTGVSGKAGEMVDETEILMRCGSGSWAGNCILTSPDTFFRRFDLLTASLAMV